MPEAGRAGVCAGVHAGLVGVGCMVGGRCRGELLQGGRVGRLGVHQQAAAVLRVQDPSVGVQ